MLRRTDAIRVDKIDTHTLARRWQEELGIDISRLIAGIESIELFEDPETGIQFFDPPIVGDKELYALLQEKDWYYLENRWEFLETIKRLPPQQRILEVGCGRGAFLDLARSSGHACVGLELNETAALKARARDLDVRNVPVSEFARTHRKQFDCAVSFQVLEHVADPIGFMHAKIAAVVPGGRVIVAVPNSGSFIKFADAILDKPPHHITRWHRRSLEALAHTIGASSVKITSAPLEEIHYDWFSGIALKRVPPLNNWLSRRALRLLVGAGLSWLISGHTILAEYRKGS